ncbi:subtilisin-like protein [Colletotrichum sp. SAR11_239]|nr:subtilisin-like protein [Colletotrichum sp. SAR11_239]
MFLEIGIGMDLDALEPEFLDWNNQPTANTSYYTARKVFNEAKETNEYIAHFGRLIERCIDLDHFVKYARDDKGLRRAIETDIVNVLYSYYRDWGKDPDVDEAKPICVANKENISSDHWFQEFDKLYRILRSPTQDVRRVKIAILDTGVLKSFKRRAILHAKNQWGAEIIVMASGFDDDNAQLEHAIEEARHAGILIFAAASNSGDLKEIAFPARTYTELKLFCMFSTKPNVRDTCDFNPSQNACARHSFAILGEDIELPSMGGIMSLSGTSYSTMIGAGVAGLVLEFVRHPDIQGRIERGRRLSNVAGMSAVFSEMATRGGNGFDCIAPWKILPVHLRGEQVDVKAAREDIITTIDRALRRR